jgi:hypothetical protein
MKERIKRENSATSGKGVTRRQFVKLTGITTVGVTSLGFTEFLARGVSIITDPEDPVAGALPVKWAVRELENALQAHGIVAKRYEKPGKARAGDVNIIVAGSGLALTIKLLKEANANIPSVPEALGLVPVKSGNKQFLLAAGYDQRGLVYALLDLVDRVQNSIDPLDLIALI